MKADWKADCMNPEKNRLLTDKSVFIQSGPRTTWWLSPDIFLNREKDDNGRQVQDPALIPQGLAPDTARQEANNQVSVRVNWTQDFPSGESLTVKLYVANPNLKAMTPDNSILIFGEDVESEKFMRSSSPYIHTKTWRAGKAINSDSPNDDGPDPSSGVHRCLIAIAYPENLLEPSPKGTFCAGLRDDNNMSPLDPHVAQRNIVILPAQTGGMISFFLQTTGGYVDNLISDATIRVIADRIPSEPTLGAILPTLRQFNGFRQVTQAAPKEFSLKVPENLSPVIRDQSRLEKVTPINPKDIPLMDRWQYIFRNRINFEKIRNIIFDNPTIVLQEAIAHRKFNASLSPRNFQSTSPNFQSASPNFQSAPNLKLTPTLAKLVEQAAPSFEADIKLPPEEVVGFTFTADLPESSQPGDAHIFHLMHIDDQKQVIGGLTLVAVVVDPDVVAPNTEAANILTNKRQSLVQGGYLAVFSSSPIFGESPQHQAQCQRDLGYYFDNIVESCRQDNVQALDEFIAGIKETNITLGYPNRWFIDFYLYIKQNHRLTGDAAMVANSYLDRAIANLS